MKRTHRLRVWFDKNVALLYLGVAVLALAGIIVAAAASLTNARQDDDQDRLLACFDDYAAKSSQSTRFVREATITRDEATTARDAAFTALFEFIATDPGEGSAKGLRLFTDLTSANSELVRAQQALEQSRKDNPVPPPPSKFCGD